MKDKLFALCLSALLLLGCATAFGETSQTTGLEGSGEYRPLIVLIGNTLDARPQWNLSEADIVYEAIYWGPSATRYTAIFGDQHPERVGSLRSAQVTHAQIRQEWDCPLVYWGGQSTSSNSVYTFLENNGVAYEFLLDGDELHATTKAFGYDKSRELPHNMIADLSLAAAYLWPKDAGGADYQPQRPAFAFSETPTVGQDVAVEIEIPYDAEEFCPSYQFSAESRAYERSYNGEPQIDGASGKRIIAANVIVQFAHLEYVNDSPSQARTTLTGTGAMHAFIDGRHIEGTWARDDMNARTHYFDANGEPFTLLPGKTFIQIVPDDFCFTYVRDDGARVETDGGSAP